MLVYDVSPLFLGFLACCTEQLVVEHQLLLFPKEFKSMGVERWTGSSNSDSDRVGR